MGFKGIKGVIMEKEGPGLGLGTKLGPGLSKRGT